MTDERHLSACALAVQEQHGDQSAAHVAEQIGALVIAGDKAGANRWKSIAVCMDALDPPLATLQ